MGHWWYPSIVPEVGIDGHLEIRDSKTGEMTNLILQVQSRATEQAWPRETRNSLDYICNEDDLQYWLAGTAPVILVLSRPRDDEAYWIPVKNYFTAHPENRASRRISIVKDESRFDKSAASPLLRLAAPKGAGVYLSPRPKPERLFSNLLAVASYSEDLHIAQTEIDDPKVVWDKVRELGTEIGCEWFLSDGNLITFHDLSQYPWNRLCDEGTHETFDTAEWAESDDPTRQRHFVRLLNHSLTEMLKQWRVRQRKSDHIYYFSAAKAFRPRRVDFSGTVAEQYRTVVQKYPSGKTSYIRHAAFGGYFKKLDNAWYLEITPSYIFTTDGFAPSNYEAELLSGIKQLEHNDSILMQVQLWVDILTRKADLIHTEYPFLTFSNLLSFDLPFGINDKEWLSHEELDVAASGLESLASLPFTNLNQ